MFWRALQLVFLVAFGCHCSLALAQPLTSALTYQGELAVSGQPVTGAYDLRFRLYDAVTGGLQVGPTLCADNVELIGGRFAVTLDFGAVFNGNQKFLEIDVRADAGQSCGVTTGFVTLAPRQALTAGPHSAFALRAGNADQATRAADATLFGGQAPAFYQNAANLTSGTLPDARLGPSVALLGNQQTFSGIKIFSSTAQFTNATAPFLVTSTGRVGNLNADLLDGQHGSFYQDAGNINAGTVPDARLGANVARLNASQAFTAQQTFSVQPVFSSASVPFMVSSTNMVPNLNANFLGGQPQAYYTNAGNLTGLLSDARLSTNIPRLDAANTFAANATFAARVGIGTSTPSAPLHLLGSAQQMFNVVSSQAFGTWVDLTNTSTGGKTWSVISSGSGNGEGAGHLLFRNTTNQLLAMAVLSSGQVGIRTTTPAQTLSVQGSIGGSGRTFIDSDDSSSGAPNDDGLILGGPSSGEVITSRRIAGENQWGIDFYTNFERRLSISNGGQVGINTSAPLADVTINGGLQIDQANLGDSVMASESPFVGLRFGANTSGVGIASRRIGMGANPDGLDFFTGFIPRVSIASNGYVGINNTSPGGMLDVGGPGQSTNYLVARGTGSTGHVLNSGQSIQQSFTAPVTATCYSIHMLVKADALGLPPANARGTISVRLLTSGGSLLASSSNNLPPSPGWSEQLMTYSFQTPPTITMGQVYLVQFTASGNSRPIRPFYHTGNPYAGGQASTNPDHDFILGISHQTPSGGTALRVTPEGNVGIGTGSPGANKLRVNGNLSATSIDAGLKSFRIDHPLDPENRELWHSCVESPDMMNIYNGNATTDMLGYATIELPEWFEALNRDFRYQLTILDDGESLPDFVAARVVAGVRDNRFRIKTSLPEVTVSWQVTGVRKDALAESNRIQVEVEKSSQTKGQYLHPEAFSTEPSSQSNHR